MPKRDWRTGEGYPGKDSPLDWFQWEFLRRNGDFILDLRKAQKHHSYKHVFLVESDHPQNATRRCAILKIFEMNETPPAPPVGCNINSPLEWLRNKYWFSSTLPLEKMSSHDPWSEEISFSPRWSIETYHWSFDSDEIDESFLPEGIELSEDQKSGDFRNARLTRNFICHEGALEDKTPANLNEEYPRERDGRSMIPPIHLEYGQVLAIFDPRLPIRNQMKAMQGFLEEYRDNHLPDNLLVDNQARTLDTLAWRDYFRFSDGIDKLGRDRTDEVYVAVRRPGIDYDPDAPKWKNADIRKAASDYRNDCEKALLKNIKDPSRIQKDLFSKRL